ncbi:MAG: DNA replication and repair protein RecF [Alistipes sp.]|nr:DNA replication and repair protein RecF [Alistipes sp.]
MYLRKLSLLNFKNIAESELTFGPAINCLVGDNGAGKTNIIDAVYYLSMCKSAFGMTDGQAIRHGAEFFLAEGQYTTDHAKSEQVVCSFSRKSGKVLKRNGKEYERLSDHVGLVPTVVVSPADSVLISDAADERRRFLNAFISTLDRAYMQTLIRYNAILAERNRLLKMQPDETMLEIYDLQLIEHGNRIFARRQEFVERLRPLVADYYRLLSEDREQVELIYKSELCEHPFEEVLRAARQKDLVNEFTTAGIHRDDLVLRIGGYPLRKYGSQGQQKSFLIALKLAQYLIMAEECGERPLLLLDDLFDKLDAGRVEQLLRLVSSNAFGQIFITDCNPTRLKSILDRAEIDYTRYQVIDGRADLTSE